MSQPAHERQCHIEREGEMRRDKKTWQSPMGGDGNVTVPGRQCRIGNGVAS